MWTAKHKKVAVNSHPLPKPLPEGLVLRDLFKGEWKIGKPVGRGGFGLLYLGQFFMWNKCAYLMLNSLMKIVNIHHLYVVERVSFTYDFLF